MHLDTNDSLRGEAARVEESAGISLYIHIPFCQSKCGYCDFNSFSGLGELIPGYVDALTRELQLRSGDGFRRVSTIYFGGGTPSLLTAAQIAGIIDACRHCFAVDRDAEISVEGNPGSITLEWLKVIRDAGVDRVSLGFQSLNDAELVSLGRVHSARQAMEAYAMAREAGFQNVSIDLIYGLPGQSLHQWQETLRRAVALSPEHFSLYPLTIEETTPLGRAIETGAMPAPDPDVAAEMYIWAEQMLEAAGYNHYELSNWARPGKASRHNLTYWRNLLYLGVGAGAHSSLDGYRLANVLSPAEYISRLKMARSPEETREHISQAARMSETIILGLRLEEGVDLDMLGNRFSLDAGNVYRREIDEVKRLGLLKEDGSILRLTSRGRLLGNEVFWSFLSKEGAAGDS